MDQKKMRWRFASELWVPCGLMIVVTALFQHIAGNLTFPWDLQHGAYFTHALARMLDG